MWSGSGPASLDGLLTDCLSNAPGHPLHWRLWAVVCPWQPARYHELDSLWYGPENERRHESGPVVASTIH